MRGRGAAAAISAGVGERVAESVVEDTGSGATFMVKEDEAVAGLGLGVVVAHTVPATATAAAARR